MDGAGCGVQHDYKKYHKHRSNTLLDTLDANNGLRLPFLEKLGLVNIINGKIDKNKSIGTSEILTPGNDTYSSVWEIMGVIFKKRFRSKHRGFSQKILSNIETKLKTKFLSNEYFSGHKIMEKYFDQHKSTGLPILYFAGDGTVLLTAHKDIMPIKKLSLLGKKLSIILKNKNIIRVITRPFKGKKGKFKRINFERIDFITNKKIFSSSILSSIKKSRVKMYATTHIKRLLNSDSAITSLINHSYNREIMRVLLKEIKKKKTTDSLTFVCLQDFDTLGHKKDPVEYAKKLSEFDIDLKKLLDQSRQDDLFIITADHGCNPTDNDRYHTREIVPLIIYSKSLTKPVVIGQRKTLSDIGQIVSQNFGFKKLKYGTVPRNLFGQL